MGAGWACWESWRLAFLTPRPQSSPPASTCPLCPKPPRTPPLLPLRQHCLPFPGGSWGNSSPSTFWLLSLPVSGCWMAGKQLIKVINTAIKAGKTEARVLAEAPPSPPPLLPSPTRPPFSPGSVGATQPALATQSPHLGAGRLRPRGPTSASLNRLLHGGVGALLDWRVGGSDGVLLRQRVYAG